MHLLTGLSVLLILGLTLPHSPAYAAHFNDYYEKADIAFENGNARSSYKLYKSAYNQAITKKEKIKALGGLIVTSEKLGKTREAIGWLENLLELSPQNKWARNKLIQLSGVKTNQKKPSTPLAKLPKNTKKKIQESLIWISNYNGLVDGDFGKRTHNSITNWKLQNGFQANSDLTPDQIKLLYAQADSAKTSLQWESFLSRNSFYSINYPAIFQIDQSKNKYGGVDLASDKGGYTLSTMVIPNTLEESISSLYHRILGQAKNDGWGELYSVQKENWFVITGEVDGGLAYSKFITNGETNVGYILIVPSFKNGVEKDIIRSIVTATVNSFKVNWRFASSYQESQRASQHTDRTDKYIKPQVQITSIPSTLSKPLPSPTQGSRMDNNLNAEKIFQKVNRSVWVVISANDKEVAQGSAVAINKNYLLTNCHVLQSIDSLIVNSNVSGQPLKVELYAANKEADRCILHSKQDLPSHVNIRPYLDINIGEKVFTVGAPQNLSLTIAEGLLSSKRSMDNIRYLQTSAPISQGSSGGGLFDGNGNLIGITTLMITTGQNLNFAIPVDDYWNDQ